MQYILLLYLNESDRSGLTTTEQERGIAAYASYAQALGEAGILVSSGRLQQSAVAATLRIADGTPHVEDGPYGNSPEQLAGYYTIEVDDVDAALAWAVRCPAARNGIVEVRPLSGMPG